MPAIQADAALLNEYPDAIDGDNVDSLANAFLTDPDGDDDAHNEPSDEVKKKKPADTNTDEDEDADDASEETPEDEGDDEGEGEDNEDGKEDETDEGSKKKFADDDDATYVKVKVGDEEHEVKVSDLKRLWGQESALTRRSQEVATAKKTYDDGMQQNVAAYNVLMQRAAARAEEYRKLPWMQLMKDPTVPPDQLQALQAEAAKAVEEETFLKQEIGGFMKKVQDAQSADRQKAAQECIKAINDTASPHHIKGWNEALYNDIRSFATAQGINPELVNGLTDPGAIKVLHMAMQFAKGKTKVVTTKVKKSPTKIVKNSASAPAARSSSKDVTTKSAVAKARKTGSMDDAVSAFEALLDAE